MLTLFVALLAGAALFGAYHTYGKWLSRRVFQMDADALVPSVELRDNVGNQRNDACVDRIARAPRRRGLLRGSARLSITWFRR